MRANELMVGDLFDVHRYECVADGGHFQEWQEYGKIVCITEDYVTVKYIAREEEYGFEDVEHSDLEPIPLTDEILEKNGFQHSMPHNDWTNADCNFYLYEGGNGYRILNTDIKLDYVHQLQHLLRLCNIDKKDFEL